MPAPAVIPAPIVYTIIVAVEKLVVEFRSAGRRDALCVLGVGASPVTNVPFT